MPRPRKPPRLLLRLDRDGKRRWIIRDNGRDRRTGCLADQTGEAAAKLADYLGETRRPDTTKRRASEICLSDVLTLYQEARIEKIARPLPFLARLERLIRFWGMKSPADIIGETCRDYVRARVSSGKGAIAARRELEMLRAAINLYAKEHGLDVVPRFTLPENGIPRERWLSRSDAAALLLASIGFVRDPETKRFHRRRGMKRRHLARFILIGLYTGTRHGAMLELQWMANTTGGWIDLQRGVLYRRAEGQRETKKRRTPVRISPRLLTHLRRWRRMDGESGHVIHYKPIEHRRPVRAGGQKPGNTQGMTRIEKAFRGIRRAAGLGPEVTPHILRHTRATWLMQSGVDLWEAAGSLGMTVQMLEERYGHHHPDFQKSAAEAY